MKEKLVVMQPVHAEGVVKDDNSARFGMRKVSFPEVTAQGRTWKCQDYEDKQKRAYDEKQDLSNFNARNLPLTSEAIEGYLSTEIRPLVKSVLGDEYTEAKDK